MSPIEKIRSLSEKSKDPLLNKIPLFENTIFDILWMLTDSGEGKGLYADVPVWSVCAATHLNIAHPGTSWRDMLYKSKDGLKLGVTGDGWTEGVFSYFENSMMENPFPAEFSRYELRLQSYGNLVSITNGVHRAIGAINYLSATIGSEKAVLKQAKILYKPIDIELLNLLRSIRRTKTNIYLSWKNHKERKVGFNIMAISKFGAKTYFYHNKKIVIKYKYLPVNDWVIKMGSALGIIRKWYPVEATLLEVLLKDDWLPNSNSISQMS